MKIRFFLQKSIEGIFSKKVLFIGSNKTINKLEGNLDQFVINEIHNLVNNSWVTVVSIQLNLARIFPIKNLPQKGL